MSAFLVEDNTIIDKIDKIADDVSIIKVDMARVKTQIEFYDKIDKITDRLNELESKLNQ